MSLLLHAIAPAPLADPPRGFRDGALEFIPTGPLGVWATAVGAGAARRDDAFEHHRVVLEICARQPCLPIRFGTRVPDPGAVSPLLAPRQDELASALDRVGRRREIAVTLLWLDARATAAAIPPPAGASGRRFLERKREAYAADERRRTAAGALADRLVAGLAADQADVRHVLCPSAEVALSCAILAPAGDEDGLKERVVRLASGLGGVRAIVSGPWPPYTFANAT